MKSLKFKRLVLVSDTLKSANQFKFGKSRNLITGKDNSIGKTSLVKSLFWAVGCDPAFDNAWKAFECKTLLEFSVGGQNYTAVRIKNSIAIQDHGSKSCIKYGTISGHYSEWFSSIVNFNIKFPARKDNTKLETPPPAYYFLPFYIDQLRSWVQPWNAFDNLGQYANWRVATVKYHTGYLTTAHFELEDEIQGYQREKRAADEEIRRINTAIEIVEAYVPKNNFASTPEEFEKITKEVTDELGELTKQQESAIKKASSFHSEIHNLSTQLAIARRAAKELEADYKFAVENIAEDELECPLCATLHDNSLVNRASILTDKQQAEDQVLFLSNQIETLATEKQNINDQLNRIRNLIGNINLKYKTSNGTKESPDLTSIVDGFAARSVQRSVQKTMVEKQSDYKNLSDKQQDLKTKQKKLQSKEKKQELNDYFLGLLVEYLEKLSSQGVSLNKVNSPMDYNKLFGSGGAAEGTRAVLAYQIAVYRQIQYASNETLSAIVIDTPRQQEQAASNYKRIVDLLIDEIPNSSQLILCGMDSKLLSTYKEGANVIQLDRRKLLQEEKYELLSNELTALFDTAAPSADS